MHDFGYALTQKITSLLLNHLVNHGEPKPEWTDGNAQSLDL